VLQTWTRALLSPPPVHSIVPGGGRSAEGTGLPSGQDFLVHLKPRSVLCRAKVRAQLQKTALCPLVHEPVGNKDWVGHGEPLGWGAPAFSYLAPYLFGVALSTNRLLRLEAGKGTCQYKDSATEPSKGVTGDAEEFIRRFLQPVLPDRFGKGRYDGVLSPSPRRLLNRARPLLGASALATTTPAHQRGRKEALGGPRGPQGHRHEAKGLT